MVKPDPTCEGARMRTWPVVLLVALLVSACSSDPDPSTPTAAGESLSVLGDACGTVDVPAHEGVDVRAVGVDCAAARDVVRVAEGRGRTAYEVDGFTCTPTPAPEGGDTFYDCAAAGDKRITFRYGTA